MRVSEEAVETKESRRQRWAPLASFSSQSGSDIHSAGLGRLRSRSFVLFSDCALGLPQHTLAYTHAMRSTRLFGVLSTVWGLSRYFKTSDWLRTATGIAMADYTRPPRKQLEF